MIAFKNNVHVPIDNTTYIIIILYYYNYRLVLSLMTIINNSSI